jgi:hypothetical protein
MRNALKQITTVSAVLLLLSSSLLAYTQKDPEERLFQEAKILIFDKNWEEAQSILEKLIEDYPGSSWFSQALFYRAKCLEEQKGKEAEALMAHKKYLLFKEKNKRFTEESEISAIDLAFTLFEKGKKSYLREIEKRLDHPEKTVRYYAAFKLSYIKNKEIGSKGISILKEILSKEHDDELKDRAKIALLRIDPDVFRDIEEERYERKVKMLKIRVFDSRKNEVKFSFNIPWALADLALSAIPEEAKRDLREEGYDLDRIIRNLVDSKEDIIEINTRESIIKIWID